MPECSTPEFHPRLIGSGRRGRRQGARPFVVTHHSSVHPFLGLAARTGTRRGASRETCP
jgi:hypothetical protein